MKRNRLFTYGLLIAAILLSLVPATGRSLAQGGSFPITDAKTGAQPFKGQTLHIFNTEVVPVLSYEHQILDPEYEKASGVKLVYENVDHDALLAKEQTMCAAKGDDYDLIFVEDGYSGALEALDCLQELDPYYKAAPGDSHPEDFALRAFGTVAMHNDKWYGMPTLIAVGIFAYRTDLFTDPKEMAAFKAKYNRELAVPQDWNELLETAQFFTRPDQGMYGLNYRYGTANNILFDYMIHFGFSRGVNFFDANYKPLFSTPEAIDAATFFTSKELQAVQPPGHESFQFGEVMQNFAQGKVAMYSTESWAIPLLLDPKASKFADKTGFAQIPGWKDPKTGKIQRALLSAGPAYMMNKNISEDRKRLAWDYLQFAYGKTLGYKLVEQSGAGLRLSSLSDPALLKKWPHIAVNAEQMKLGIGRPNDPWWPKAENAIGKQLQDALAGTTPVKDAMTKANTEIEAIVHDAGFDDGKHHYITVEEREKLVCKKFADLGVTHPECK